MVQTWTTVHVTLFHSKILSSTCRSIARWCRVGTSTSDISHSSTTSGRAFMWTPIRPASINYKTTTLIIQLYNIHALVLPRQQCVLQVSRCLLTPLHRCPRQKGLGLLQDLPITSIPAPQGSEHSVITVQLLHPPSTVYMYNRAHRYSTI